MYIDEIINVTGTSVDGLFFTTLTFWMVFWGAAIIFWPFIKVIIKTLGSSSGKKFHWFSGRYKRVKK